MAVRKWTLLDTEKQVNPEKLSIQEGNFSIHKYRLSGGSQDGIDVVDVCNGLLSFTVLLTRGMGIWRGKCGNVDLKWNAPIHGPVHPNLVPLMEPSGLGWLYGFNEWLVRCGLENNGAPEFDASGRLVYPLHGRIANIPASFAEVSFDTETGEIRLEGIVHETRMFSRKLELQVVYTTKVGMPSLAVQDTITNRSAENGSFQLLYHINTGMPFAAPGARAVVPYKKMAPRSPAAKENLPNWNLCGPEISGSEEVVFFFDPAADDQGNTNVMLIGAEKNGGILLKFNKNQFPCFSLWKSRLADADGYVTGIEPAVNFPNMRSFEEAQGRVVPLSPGETKTFDLDFHFLQNETEISDAEKKIDALLQKADGKIVDPKEIGWVP